ncbi:hypothetical protein Tco_0908986 [Tanacetum coccineum]|uniref:Uncharacterized protein n=1 Tax=Tanacetum coccineum TaxID=301880 RepID=A0ABQ5CS48_9ASTR
MKRFGSDMRVMDQIKRYQTRHGCKHDVVLPYQDDVGESSVDKNGNVNVNEEHRVVVDKVNVDLNVNEEQTVNVDKVNVNLNVNDYTIDDNYEFNVQGNLNLDDYTVNVYKNVNVDENMILDENVNGRCDDKKYFIIDEEYVIDEVKLNMESFTFSVEEQGVNLTVTPNVDLTYEALEVVDFI